MPIAKERFERMVDHAKEWVAGQNLAHLPLEQRILYVCVETGGQKINNTYMGVQMQNTDRAEKAPSLEPLALEAVFYNSALHYIITGEQHYRYYFKQDDGQDQVDQFFTALGYQRPEHQ